jgi:hypothetical protein
MSYEKKASADIYTGIEKRDSEETCCEIKIDALALVYNTIYHKKF